MKIFPKYIEAIAISNTSLKHGYRKYIATVKSTPVSGRFQFSNEVTFNADEYSRHTFEDITFKALRPFLKRK